MAEAMASTHVGAEPAEARQTLAPEELAPHFPQLEIIECLGRGGMGVVYKARQKSLSRLVALKLLAPERVGDPKFADRFSREAHALAALNHPSIVTVYDFGQAGGFYFLLMEFVDGVNLRQLLRARKFTPEEALTVVPPLCDALQFAHERGIVHRDIKPENILLDKTGRVKIADFGIAKMFGPGNGDSRARTASQESVTQSTMGTPGYSAPEQKAEPQRVDSRADIYSLGVVFYEMLTGELPGKPIEPPSRKVQIDVRLDQIVLRALEQKPELRYQQASQVKTEVETFSGSAAPRSKPKAPEGIAVAVRTNAMNILYRDGLIEITDQEIVFRRYYFPFGGDRHVAWRQIESVQVRPPSIGFGSWRIWGGGPRTWFPLDWGRPSRDAIFVAILRGGIMRIGFTVEDSTKVIEIFQERGYLHETRSARPVSSI
jgi:serine/threonine protein kinase